MASQMTETLRNRTLFEVWLHLLFAVPSSPQSQIMIVEWRHSQTVIVKRLRTSLLSNKRDLMPENDSAKNQTEYSSELTQKSNFWCISSDTSTIWWVSCLAIDFCATDLYCLSKFDCVCWILQHKVLRAGCHIVFSNLDWLWKLSVEVHLLKPRVTCWEHKNISGLGRSLHLWMFERWQICKVLVHLEIALMKINCRFL